MTRRNVKPIPTTAFTAKVESLNHDGRGVAHIDGKTIFIDGALPDEVVAFQYVIQRKRYDGGRVVEIIVPSSFRVAPRCPHFGICGGCSLQHLAPEAQIMAKQRQLLDALKHIGRVVPEEVLPPLTAEAWGYRRKARLGAKYVDRKGAMLVGFREKRSSLLAELSRCDVLHPAVGQRIGALRELLKGLAAYKRIPQVEVAIGDDDVAFVFRHLDELSEADRQHLIAFGQRYDIHIYLQPKGPDSVHLLWPEHSELNYRLGEFDVELKFAPTDFIQINAAINQKIVGLALQLLDPQSNERVLDLFCGLGNFTLPLARRAQHVVAVEGEEGLVVRGRQNARHNGIENVQFHAADLSLEPRQFPWYGGGFDKILLDPPRSGAYEVVQNIKAFGAARIVYVSCNPATLARDAEVLINAGYMLRSAGVMDMFPHTTHVESIALFEC